METNSESNWNLTPRHLLIGHTAPVKCIAKANAGSESHYAVTSSENGEMFIWDTVDGRCIENKQIPGLIHTSIQVSTYHTKIRRTKASCKCISVNGICGIPR